METQGIVVLPGQGSVWNMSPGRSAALKLLGGATGGSVMLFEETVPAGTMSTFHLHHDSDEVAYVLSGEVTFKIGEEVTVGGPGTCAFMPRGVPHAWKNSGAETGRVLFLYTPARAGCCFSILRPGRAGCWRSSSGRTAPSPRWTSARRPNCAGAMAGRSSDHRRSKSSFLSGELAAVTTNLDRVMRPSNFPARFARCGA